jgi:hypothetical protein
MEIFVGLETFVIEIDQTLVQSNLQIFQIDFSNGATTHKKNRIFLVA